MQQSKVRYKVFIIWFILGFITDAVGQRTEWFTMNDCSSLVQPSSVAADNYGNVYVYGQFDQEAVFKSVNPDDKQISAYAPWKQTYLMKYDRNGVLKYINFIPNRGGNSDMTYPGPMKVLNDGRIAVIVYCNSTFAVVDQLQTTEFRSYKAGHLLIFNDAGVLSEYIDLPLSHCSYLEQTEFGDIYVMGRPKGYRSSYRNTELYLIPNGRNKAEKVEVDLKNEGTVAYYYNYKLWLLTFEAKPAVKYRKLGTYTLNALRPGTSGVMDEVFQKDFYGFSSIKPSFTVSGNALNVSFLIDAAGPNSLEIDGVAVPMESRIRQLIVYDANGAEKARTQFNAVAGSDYLAGTSDGGYIFQASAYDTLKMEGYPEIPCNRIAPFKYELFYIKLNSALRVEWTLKGGGVPDNFYSNSVFALKGKELYSVSRLLDFGEFDFGRREVDWRFGMYVRKISLE